MQKMQPICDACYDRHNVRAICDSIDDTYVSCGKSTLCELIRRYACGYAIIVQAFFLFCLVCDMAKNLYK